ncbi:hypothetical protein JZ751_029706, partial [Albula glossodonta]
QQWIWLQTHYYITYHQWNSKPEFIVCTHTVVSYAEVRTERRRELGMEESSSEIAPSSSIKSHEVFLEICPETTQERVGRAPSVSSHSSRKSSHTALSDSPSNSSIRHTETSTPSRQSVPMATNKAPPRAPPSSSKALQSPTSSSFLPQSSNSLSPPCSQPAPMAQPPLGVMSQLKEQLEERTRVLQDDIKTQQQGLYHIKEQLQLLQMLLQKPQSVTPVQQSQAGPSRPKQGGVARGRDSSSKQPILGQEQLCSPSSSSPLVLSAASTQGQRSGGSGQMQTYSNLTTPLYNTPAPFPQVSTRPSSRDLGQRHMDSEFCSEGQLRAPLSSVPSASLLLNQPIQSLLPDSALGTQAAPCSTLLHQTKYTVEQQAVMAPLSQLGCSALIVPPIMISHNGFLTPQTQPQQTPQCPLQLQQQHCFQIQPPGMQTQSLFQTTHVPQQSTMGYVQPQQQHRHSQNQTDSLSNMQLPR